MGGDCLRGMRWPGTLPGALEMGLRHGYERMLAERAELARRIPELTEAIRLEYDRLLSAAVAQPLDGVGEGLPPTMAEQRALDQALLDPQLSYRLEDLARDLEYSRQRFEGLNAGLADIESRLALLARSDDMEQFASLRAVVTQQGRPDAEQEASELAGQVQAGQQALAAAHSVHAAELRRNNAERRLYLQRALAMVRTGMLPPAGQRTLDDGTRTMHEVAEQAEELPEDTESPEPQPAGDGVNRGARELVLG